LLSDQTVRVRLNRSGDRQLNQALHVVVLTRLRYDPATRAYAPQRRRAQGKISREINAAWSATLPVSCSDCWSAKQAAGSWFDHPISNRDHAQTARRPTPSRRGILKRPG
jgi:hypothetical protein